MASQQVALIHIYCKGTATTKLPPQSPVSPAWVRSLLYPSRGWGRGVQYDATSSQRLEHARGTANDASSSQLFDDDGSRAYHRVRQHCFGLNDLGDS